MSRHLGIGLSFAGFLALVLATFAFMSVDRVSGAVSAPTATVEDGVQPPVLLRPAPGERIESSAATRQRQNAAVAVRLDSTVLIPGGGQRLRLWLGAERGYLTLTTSAGVRDVAGTVSYTLTAEGEGFGNLTLTNDGELFGSLWFGDSVFEIGPAGEGDLYQVRRMAPETVSAVEHQAVPVSVGAGYEDSVDMAPATASHVIDVLALATPAFCEEIGRRSVGRLDETAEIAGLMAATNAMLARSGAAVRLRLVGIDEVDAADDGAGDDLLLEALRDGADRFAEVARQRAALGADLVILFLPEREGAAGSTAVRPMRSADLTPENGFAIVRCGDSRFADELSLARAFGSLMGLAGGAVSDDTPARRPFLRGAWGHYFGPSVRYPFGSAGERGTVMTAARAIVPFYSNPQIILGGMQLGKWNGQRGDANAVRALNSAAARVSRYQEMAKNTPPEVISWVVGEYNISEFTFKDLQGFDDFDRIHIEFTCLKLDRLIEFIYSPKTDIYTVFVKNEGKIIRRLSEVIQGNPIGTGYCLIYLNNLGKSSLVKYQRKLGFRMLARFYEQTGVVYRVRAKAYDKKGTTRGWRTVGYVRPEESASMVRSVSPSIDEARTLIPKIQLLENADKKFLVGPDIYAGMYNYPRVEIQQGTPVDVDVPLSDWAIDVADHDMNYIRLILQANAWTDRTSWLDGNGNIKTERSIFKKNTSEKYTLEINTGSPAWAGFLDGLLIAKNRGVTFQIDLSDDFWCKSDILFRQSEYHAQFNSLGHVPNDTGYNYRRAIPLAWLHDYDTTIGSFGSYSATNDNFEKMIRGQQNLEPVQSLTEAIAAAVVAKSGAYHILGDGNELCEGLDEVNVSNYIYSRAVLTSPGVLNYGGPKAVGNANLWPDSGSVAPDPDGNLAEIQNLQYLCLHHTLNNGGIANRDDYITRYQRVSGYVTGGRRVLFSTDGARPELEDVRRLYYDLLTEHQNSSGVKVDIGKVGGLGDIKIDGEKIADIDTLLMYWRDQVNKPPVVKSGTITQGATERIKTFTFVIDDLDGATNLNTVEIAIDGASIANFAGHGAFANSAHLKYTEEGNLLELANNAGTFSGGATISSTASDPNLPPNSQVDITSASVTKSGDRLTLTVTCSFFQAYYGTKTVYLRVTDDNKGDAHYDTQYMSFWGSITLPTPPQYGQVRVVFSPAADATDEANWYRRKWQINGVSYNSGDTSALLLTGTYTVSFTRRWGFQKPDDRPVTVLANQVIRIDQPFDNAIGDVRGQVKPPAARNAGAKWRLVGFGNWQLHNYTYSDVEGPKQTVHFKQITGWSKPADFFVPIKPGLSLDTETFGNVIYSQPAPVTMDDDPEEDPPGDGLSVNFTKLMSTGDIKVDFDGDGQADIALYCPSDGSWQVYKKGTIATWGGGEDCYPVPADYNGDGKTDIAVYYAEKSLWSIKGIGEYVVGEPWGNPVPGDYNGDGITDLAVYNEKTGETAVLILEKGGKSTEMTREKLSLGFVFSGDFDGDRKADFAGYDVDARTWYAAAKGRSAAGTEEAIPLLGDFNGDGKTDFCFFEAAEGVWRMDGIGESRGLGMTGDVPVVADFNNDGKSDIAIFRPLTGEWTVNGKTFVFGKRGDIPLAGGR